MAELSQLAGEWEEAVIVVSIFIIGRVSSQYFFQLRQIIYLSMAFLLLLTLKNFLFVSCSIHYRISSNICEIVPDNEALRIWVPGFSVDILFHYGVWI